MARLKMTTTTQEIKTQVLFVAREKIEKAFKKSVSQIQDKIAAFLRSELRSDSTLQSIKDGKLALDFGLSPGAGSAAVEDIISAIERAVIVELIATKDKKSIASLVVKINPIVGTAAMSRLVSGSTYDSNGHEIAWLNWLLTRGVGIIIGGWDVTSTVSYDQNSRSGQGFMIKSGGMFRVDPQFAGVEGNNFITRALTEYQPAMSNIIQKVVKGNL